MNKKLLTLAVAATLAAPAIASAEAILYGKVHASLDYEDIENVIAPVYNDTATAAIFGVDPTTGVIFLDTPADPGNDVFVNELGKVVYELPTGTPVPAADADLVRGTVRIAPGQVAPGVNFKGWGMSKNPGFRGEGRASRLGVKGSEDLGNGLKAIYQVEFGINLNDTDSNPINNRDAITYRNTFVGLAGDWGTMLFGRHDTPFKISTGKLDLFADTMADYNGTLGFDDKRADNVVAYISPNWSGFQLAAAIVPAGGGNALGTNTSTFQNINSDQINGAWSLATIYSNGPFYAAAAYESINAEMFNTTATSLTGCFPDSDAFGTSFSCDKVEDDYTKWRIGLGVLNWNGFYLTAIYESQELPTTPDYANFYGIDSIYSYNLPSGPDSRDIWQIQAGYGFGNFMFKGMYGQSSDDGDYNPGSFVNSGITGQNQAAYLSALEGDYENEVDAWALGVDYNFSKRTTAYALYTQVDSDNSDTPYFVWAGSASRVPSWDGFSIGMMHSF